MNNKETDTEDKPFTNVSEINKCPDCDGNGWTAEHDPFDPHENGQCQNCPIQVQCERCMGTGKILK